jgi:hypothetical protein
VVVSTSSVAQQVFPSLALDLKGFTSIMSLLVRRWTLRGCLCDAYSSAETKSTAKTIDMCNNPQTKTPKVTCTRNASLFP